MQPLPSLLLLVWAVRELLLLVERLALRVPFRRASDVRLARLLSLGFQVAFLFAGFGARSSLFLLSLELGLCMRVGQCSGFLDTSTAATGAIGPGDRDKMHVYLWLPLLCEAEQGPASSTAPRSPCSMLAAQVWYLRVVTRRWNANAQVEADSSVCIMQN